MTCAGGCSRTFAAAYVAGKRQNAASRGAQVFRSPIYTMF